MAEYTGTGTPFVWACKTCGATVYAANTDLHTQWHEGEAQRTLLAVDMRSFDRNAQAYKDFGAQMGHPGGHYG